MAFLQGLKLHKHACTLLLSLALCCAGSTVSLAAEAAGSAQESPMPFTGKVQLDTTKGHVGDTVHIRLDNLAPDKEVNLSWRTVEGSYQLEGLYTFIGAVYKDKDIDIAAGKSDSNGVWEGSFQVPEGFGGNHTISVWQGEQKKTQANFYVDPSFTMSPDSGLIGTEITITAHGIGSKQLESNWQLTYDNKLTGMISAVATNGKAVAKFRAAGPVGKHTITIWHGYLGMPYVNHQQAPNSYLPVPSFIFEVTDDAPVAHEVEKAPESAAGGGVVMPALHNEPGVAVQLDKTEGVVGENVVFKASGLPANQSFDLVWNTMAGSRVSGNGFGSVENILTKLQTDESGNVTLSFSIPQDLGGIPHRIDVKDALGKIYGQAYLRILPSIVQVTPTTAKAGDEIVIELNGVGWTEYDNTYYINYDNAYMGYVCGFNTQGNVKFTLIAAGEPGYHIIDLFPGIYRGKTPLPNFYNLPQLTYGEDHPGSAIPAIHLGINIVK